MMRFYKTHISSLWFGIETWAYIIFALALGLLMPWIDRLTVFRRTALIDKSTITAILSAIASGMITLSGVVFSLVFVLVQLGNTTYSPRITIILSKSLVLRHSLGIFTGTFLYSLMALRMSGMEHIKETSGISILIAFLWLLASIVVLAKLIKVFANFRVTNVLSSLGFQGRKIISQIYRPFSGSDQQARVNPDMFRSNQINGYNLQRIIYRDDPVYVIGYSYSKLAKIAQRTDTLIYLPYSIGDSVKDNSELVLIKGKQTNPVDEIKILKLIKLGLERRFKGDPRYVLRLLVDTAIRALSPAINDPTTATQALDQIESLLYRLGNSDLVTGEFKDPYGTIRLICKTPEWNDYLELGLLEIMHYGMTSLQISRRLEALFLSLIRSVPPSRAIYIDQLHSKHQELAASYFDKLSLLKQATNPDRDGLGSGK